jgi:hypothetical protein
MQEGALPKLFNPQYTINTVEKNVQVKLKWTSLPEQKH